MDKIKIANELIKLAKDLVAVRDKTFYQKYMKAEQPYVQSIGSEFFKKCKLNYKNNYSYTFLCKIGEFEYKLILWQKHTGEWKWECGLSAGEKLIEQKKSSLLNEKKVEEENQKPVDEVKVTGVNVDRDYYLQTCVEDLKKNIQTIDEVVRVDAEKRNSQLSDPETRKRFVELGKKMSEYKFTSKIKDIQISKLKKYFDKTEDLTEVPLQVEVYVSSKKDGEKEWYLVSFFGCGKDKTYGKMFRDSKSMLEAVNTIIEYFRLKRLLNENSGRFN